MSAVLDASAVVRALVDASPLGASVRQRLAGLPGIEAPGLLDYEVTSALLGLVRGKKLTGGDADRAANDYGLLRLRRHETLLLWPRVAELHRNLSAYDAHYVALAETLGLPLITCDARISRSGAARCAVEVYG